MDGTEYHLLIDTICRRVYFANNFVLKLIQI